MKTRKVNKKCLYKYAKESIYSFEYIKKQWFTYPSDEKFHRTISKIFGKDSVLHDDGHFRNFIYKVNVSKKSYWQSLQGVWNNGKKIFFTVYDHQDWFKIYSSNSHNQQSQ